MTKQFDKITAFSQLHVSLEDQVAKAAFKREVELILAELGMIKRNAKKYKNMFSFDQLKPGVSPVAEMIRGNNPNLLPAPQPVREKSN